VPKDGRGPVEGELVVGGVHDVHPGVDELLRLSVEVALVVVHVRQLPVGSSQFLEVISNIVTAIA